MVKAILSWYDITSLRILCRILQDTPGYSRILWMCEGLTRSAKILLRMCWVGVLRLHTGVLSSGEEGESTMSSGSLEKLPPSYV